jgi:hypothetical protein
MRLVALLHSQESQHGGYREDKNCKEHKDTIGLGRPTPRYHNFRVGEPVPALIIAAATTIEDVVEDYLGSTVVIYVTIAVHTRDLDSEYLCRCQSKHSTKKSRKTVSAQTGTYDSTCRIDESNQGVNDQANHAI